MKMYKKSKLKYKNGYLVKDGKIVNIDNDIVYLFNKLEKDYQQAMFEREHPVLPAMPQPKFKFETEHGKVYAHVEAKTPKLDEMTMNTVEMLDELDNIEKADEANDYFESVHKLIKFANSKYIVSCDQTYQEQFDLKYLGNPLELSKLDICNIVIDIFGLEQ